MALASFCGPAAPACAIGLGIGSWLLTDKAIVEADEYLNREEEKAELMLALDAQRQTITDTFIQARTLAVTEQYGRLSESFNVPRDGRLRDAP
jgi:hypothetical protein